MTVNTLLATIGSAELTEWMAFERIEPFGALADEMRLGIVAASVFNAQRGKESDHFFTPSEFMPALRRAVQGHRPEPAGRDLSDDQHTALIDACIFGMTKQ